MSSQATAGGAEPARQPARPRLALPSRAALGAVLIGFVATASFQARPAPGGHGTSLGVSIALALFAVSTAGYLVATGARPATLAAPLLIAALSAAALIGLQPHAAGVLGVFPVVAVGALHLPVRVSAVLAGAALAAVSAAWGAAAQIPVVGIVLNDSGVLAFYVVAMFARRLREANERTGLLLAELEQTRAAQAQAAAMAERQRLAREMHDVLAHSLSGLVLNLESARVRAGRGGTDPQVGDAIDRAHRLARAGLLEARRAIGMLRDDALPGPERLPDLAADFERDSGVACTVAVTGAELNLGSDGRLTLYRVAQEALTNIRKHARPDRVELRLDYDSAGARLVIEDFGPAGQLPPGDGGGYGLTGMAERAELLGGTLTAGPTGRGFLVDLWVPA